MDEKLEAMLREVVTNHESRELLKRDIKRLNEAIHSRIMDIRCRAREERQPFPDHTVVHIKDGWRLVTLDENRALIARVLPVTVVGNVK